MVKTAYVKWYEKGKVNLLEFAEKVHTEDPIRFYSPEFQLYLKAAAKRFGTLNEMKALGYFTPALEDSNWNTAAIHLFADSDAFSAVTASSADSANSWTCTVCSDVEETKEVEETKPNVFVRAFLTVKRFFKNLFNK